MPPKKKIFMLDLCMIDECNLSCDYCRNEPSISKGANQSKQINKVKKGLQIIFDYIDPAIIKISGYGEITLYPKFRQLLDLKGSSSLQIITNGTLLTKEVISDLAKRDNISLCYSLDGHTLQTNIARTKSQKTLEKVLENLKTSIELGIPTEINSVLTKWNTTYFHEFLSYLNEFSQKSKFMVIPFPVRPFPGRDNNYLFPQAEDIIKFEDNVINNYKKYSNILPPYNYLKELVTFLKRKKRGRVCYVPSFNMGINPQGDILTCPCGPKESIGNIFSKSRVNLNKHPYETVGRWKECYSCFNHYEIINLYLQGNINDNDLTKVPSLYSKKALSVLSQLKKRVLRK